VLPLLAFLRRLCGTAPHHHLRAAIVHAACTDQLQPHPAPRRWLNWADLLKRVFAVDVLVCDTCGGSMRILAVLPAGEASRAILELLGLPTEPPLRMRAPLGRQHHQVTIFEPNYMSGEYLRPDLHLAPRSVTPLTQRTSPRSTYQSLARATQLTRLLPDFRNAGYFTYAPNMFARGPPVRAW
jgi:hypothetical protein